METGLIIVGTSVLVFVLTYLLLSARIKVLSEKLQDKLRAYDKLNMDLTGLLKRTEELRSANQQLELELRAYKEKELHLNQRIKQISEDDEKKSQQFELLARRILQKQSQSFMQHQSKGMTDILDPLKQKIKSFEEKIEKTNIDSVKMHEALKQQIVSLNEKSDKVSQDANNLAKALKGDFKKQGVWGEMILESILDKSGLEKDREYFTQLSLKNDSGKNQRPDVIIKLPDEKILIIDSKVSLSAYVKMIDASDENAAKNYQSLHLNAVKKHIDQLAEKKYNDLYKVESPDFVLMFIPIDTAFTAALEADQDLYNYAFDKNIVIVSSSTLLATLKTVESMWRNDKQNRNAIAIASEAGKMYDKFVNFLKDFEKLGSQINTVQNTYRDSMRKLYVGSGNLVSRAEKIKKLGAKATKRIESASYIE